MQNGNSHNWAETEMRKAVVVRRLAWPAGKVAYYDVENDGTPDIIANWDAQLKELQREPLTFIQKSRLLYEGFLQYVRIAVDGMVDPSLYITQEDALANDWVAV